MIFDSTNLMACSDFSVWNILCSFSSFVYHFVNFFNQPLTALRMEYIVELTKMLCYAILFKQIHHILSSHILCLGYCSMQNDTNMALSCSSLFIVVLLSVALPHISPLKLPLCDLTSYFYCILPYKNNNLLR